jgi:hypothetical protein
VVIEEGALLDEAMVAQIEEIGVQGVKIRSPLICASKQGVCAKCYGRDLAAARRSTSARRSESSPPSRSASRARS